MANKRKGGFGKAKDGKRFKKWTAPGTTLQAGMRGVFVTCPRRKESQATSEVCDLLSEYADRHFPATSETVVETDDEEDVEAAIQKEVATLNAPAKKADRIVPIDLSTDCFFFVKTRSPIQPVELLGYIFADLVAAESKRSRYIQRLIPATRLSLAQLDRMKECMKEILPESRLSADAEATSYAIEYRKRSHDTLHREEVLNAIGDCVPAKHRVDLKNPTVHIMVEIFKNVCGIGIVMNFRKYRKFNVQELFEPEKGQGHQIAEIMPLDGEQNTRSINPKKIDSLTVDGIAAALEWD